MWVSRPLNFLRPRADTRLKTRVSTPRNVAVASAHLRLGAYTEIIRRVS